MRIPLYNTFGDNYIIQLATEAGGAKILPKCVEIDDDRLMEVLKLAAQIAKERERQKQEAIKKSKKQGNKVGILIPLHPNDRRYGWKGVLSCYGYTENTQLSEMFEKFEVKKCDEVSAPTFIKPERYESDRAGGEVKVEPYYVILATAGWVLTRIGTIIEKKDKNVTTIGVHVFSPEGGILYSLNKRIAGRLLGTKPETAFSLWISKKVLDVLSANAFVSFLKVYTITDPIKNQPTVINGEFTVEVGKILAKAHLLTGDLEDIVLKALKSDYEMRDYYIRLVNYIYEYINGAKRIEDLLYFANRDLLMNLKSKVKLKEDLKRVAYYVNRILIREMRGT